LLGAVREVHQLVAVVALAVCLRLLLLYWQAFLTQLLWVQAAQVLLAQ
jgi:hypothetical protein